MDKINAQERRRLLTAAHRDIWLRSQRKRLLVRDFTILSNECVGGFIYKDLGLPYLTPTVAMTIGRRDFIRLCLNLRAYMEQELVEVKAQKPYPVGRVGDVEIRFVHDGSFSEARAAWERRKARINYERVFVVCTAGKHWTSQDREDFGLIPYPKVLFVPFETESPYEFYISGFEEKGYLVDITGFQRPGRRYFEQFDFVRFLNQKEIVKERALT